VKAANADHAKVRSIGFLRNLRGCQGNSSKRSRSMPLVLKAMVMGDENYKHASDIARIVDPRQSAVLPYYGSCTK
jgi:hypothetical protein